jgi:hypothetical protein
VAPGAAAGGVRAGRGRRIRAAADRLESEGEVVGRAKAGGRVLFEAASHDEVEDRRNGRTRGRDVGWLLLEDGGHRLGRCLACERAAAAQHLVQHDPEREDVGARVDPCRAHLLGGHVRDGANDGAGLREPRFGRRLRVIDRRSRRGELGEAEVEDLDPSVGEDEQVLGLEVAMDDALVVSGGEAAGDLRGPARGASRGYRALRQPLAQRLSLEPLEDEVRSTLVLAGVEDRKQVRVVEGARGEGLLLEAAEAGRILAGRRGQHLHRDIAPEPWVEGAPDLAHAPRAERSPDLVRSETDAWGERQSGLRDRKDSTRRPSGEGAIRRRRAPPRSGRRPSRARPS